MTPRTENMYRAQPMSMVQRFWLLVSRRARQRHEQEQKAIIRELVEQPDALVVWPMTDHDA